jgi:arylsulfatase A-like enzyme
MSQETSSPKPKQARNAIVILLDSLNRHMLGSYGGNEFDTPNLDRLAARSTRFERHYTGSLPCMPARHDILVGALDFLWKPWGSIEVWERPITAALRKAGVNTMLVTDHPHLFEHGGENYHCDFFAWDYVRGHEGDPWRSRPDPSWMGAPALPAATRMHERPYDRSRTWFREELDFPGPRTMRRAADWLEENAGHHDRFMLFVDEFDPHEPFDTPEPWAGRYDADWEDELIIWPPYAVGGIEKGALSEREGRHIRANYGSKLSMIDHWLGRVLDVIDRKQLWEDTAVILCTDHGHYLGEKDIWGKPGVMQYETLGHTPLMIAHPDVAPGTCSALTTNVDIHATLEDLFGVTSEHQTHGHSLLPLLQQETDNIRDYAIGGVFGRWVQIQDGRHKYARSAEGSGFPLSLFSNRWSTMPIDIMPQLRLPPPNERAILDRMPGSEIPVIRQPYREGDLLPFWSLAPPVDEHFLFDLENDPDEQENLQASGDDARLEEKMIELLRVALRDVEAPDEQFERLGIA